MQRKLMDMVPPAAKKAMPPPSLLAQEALPGKKVSRKRKRVETPSPSFPESVARLDIPFEYRRRRRWWIRLFWVGGALILAFFVSLLVIPRVRVVILPRSDDVKEEMVVGATQSINTIDVTSRLLPAEVVEVTKTASQEFSATGEGERESKAGGVIMVTNTFSPAPQILVRTTRFRSPDGKIFRTTQTVTVPGTKSEGETMVAGSISVAVVADKPGEEYNIGPTTFRLPGFEGGPKFDKITGRSEESMRGGARGKTTIVTADDIAKGTDILRSKLESELTQELNAKLLPGYVLLDGAHAFEVVSIDSLPPQGETASTFRLQVRAKRTAVVFREQDLKNLIERSILERFPEERRISDKDRVVEPHVERLEVGKGRLHLKVLIAARAEGAIDSNKLLDQIVGRSEGEVVEILRAQSGISQVKITFWPPWVSTFPEERRDIRVRLSEP